MNKDILKVVLSFSLLIFVVVSLSILSNKVWTTKSEKIELVEELKINNDMTLIEFGQKNNFSNPVLKEIFNLKTQSDLDKKISVYGNETEISSLVKKKVALISEENSKNWIKILIKFILWFSYLLFVFIFLKNRKVTPIIRNSLYFSSIFIFGIILGADPSPMGTVKDAIYLLGSAKTIFPPRMIALTVFLFLVFIANKYICSWGCQAGVLQDFIFRLNRKENKAVIFKQFKIPFVITNSIRILFFVILTTIAFVWSFDIIEPIDIFKIYKPVHLGIIGIIFTGIILILSLFIYRPWCHFLCPFGLVSWIVEKISFVKINVDYSTCIACKKCSNACPSTVMSAILLRDKKTIPDCFSCYACKDVCPTNSVQFSSKKREKPHVDFFKKK